MIVSVTEPNNLPFAPALLSMDICIPSNSSVKALKLAITLILFSSACFVNFWTLCIEFCVAGIASFLGIK